MQELKIDKSFVLGIADDPQAATIVETVVDLAHSLGLRAVGEGEHVRGVAPAPVQQDDDRPGIRRVRPAPGHRPALVDHGLVIIRNSAARTSSPARPPIAPSRWDSA